MIELKLPSLGEGIEKGKIISVLVKVGDQVEAEQSLIEVETDKVVVEVPAEEAGTVSDILVNLGDEVSEGVTIVRLDNGERDVVSEITTKNVEAKPTADEKDEMQETAVLAALKTNDVLEQSTPVLAEIKLPELGEGIEKGTVISILVKEGDKISAEQSLIEVETDKVVVEVPSDVDGTIKNILVNIGDEIGEGIPIFKVLTSGSENTVEVLEESTPEKVVPAKKIQEKVGIPIANTTVKSQRNGKFRASPLARKMAKEIGIDITNITATKNSSRISLKDVKDYAKQLNENRGSQPVKKQEPLPDFAKWGEIKTESLSGIAQATAKNMNTSWSNIPHAWLQEKVDITMLEQKRQEHKISIKEKGGSLTITSILVKVMAKALEEFPLFNASFSEETNEIIYKNYINVGVAVDTDRGLLVPGLKNANEKSIGEIAIELREISQKVKQKKIAKEELEGITFTISNLGGIGTTSIFPLVTFPQVAILGVAASQTEAIWLNNAFEPRLMMPITVGFDHRVINGADAARFLKHVKALLEDWFLLNL